MRAMVMERYRQTPEVRDVPDPEAPVGGVVVRVGATGLCRSDWHAWAGHDPVELPHVPGHEFAGVVVGVGAGVDEQWLGRRVTAPFVQACGTCAACRSGDAQVCGRQEQPGFTFWGSFAEYVVVRNAPMNLVPLPDEIDERTAAVLGCRFATSFRAVTQVGAVRAGEWVAVHGCGGVGLSAVMIAAAAGARVVAVDVSPAALALAREHGAEAAVDGSTLAPPLVAAAVREIADGGAHLSLDALGLPATATASVLSLRRRGRHVQVGLLPPGEGLPAEVLNATIAGELALLGSHGMSAHSYPQLLGLVSSGRLRPRSLVTGTLTLEAACDALATMGSAPPTGIHVILPNPS